MTRPFFSVVIPTKNRSFLVGLAIQSVLRQSFDDFEIVIADNDDTDATRLVIESFTDPRIHYYRSGGLSMPDNWEFAVGKSEGEYVAILEDKQVLKRHALKRVFAEVEHTRYPVVGWLYDRYYDTQQPPKIINAEGNGNAMLIPSRQIIETFVKYGRLGECDRLMPRGLNSCIHRDLLDRIRTGPAGRLCLPVAPDFSMGFQQLAYCNSILHIDEALVVVGGFSHSTGRTIKINRDALKYFQGSEWDESLSYNRVPIKKLTIAGFLYNDYENVRSLVGGNLSNYPVEMYAYFMQCFNDIHNSRKMGADTSAELTEWERALCEQDLPFQNSVYRNLLADETAANVSALSQLAEMSSTAVELRASRDRWKKRSQELEKKYKFINRFSPVYWMLLFAKLLRIPVDSKFSSPEVKDAVKYSNALEFVIWEEAN